MIITLFTAYNYCLYKDKNRDLDAIVVDNYEKESEKKQKGGLSWDKTQDRPWIILFLLSVFIIEVIILYSAIMMALKVSKTNLQLILHLIFAIFLSGPYVFLNTVLNTPAYDSLASSGGKLFKS